MAISLCKNRNPHVVCWVIFWNRYTTWPIPCVCSSLPYPFIPATSKGSPVAFANGEALPSLFASWLCRLPGVTPPPFWGLSLLVSCSHPSSPAAAQPRKRAGRGCKAHSLLLCFSHAFFRRNSSIAHLI